MFRHGTCRTLTWALHGPAHHEAFLLNSTKLKSEQSRRNLQPQVSVQCDFCPLHAAMRSDISFLIFICWVLRNLGTVYTTNRWTNCLFISVPIIYVLSYHIRWLLVIGNPMNHWHMLGDLGMDGEWSYELPIAILWTVELIKWCCSLQWYW